MHKKINLEIKGMHCKSCEMLITDELIGIGAKNVEVNHKTGDASFINDQNADDYKIISAIKNAGYEGTILNPSAITNTTTFAFPPELDFDAKISKDENGEFHISGKLK